MLSVPQVGLNSSVQGVCWMISELLAPGDSCACRPSTVETITLTPVFSPVASVSCWSLHSPATGPRSMKISVRVVRDCTFSLSGWLYE